MKWQVIPYIGGGKDGKKLWTDTSKPFREFLLVNSSSKRDRILIQRCHTYEIQENREGETVAIFIKERKV